MFALGVDVGGTSIKSGLVDGSGSVLEKKSIITDNNNFVSSFYSLIDSFIGVANERNIDLIGIGVGTPGFVDSDGVIRGAYNISGLNGLPFLKMLSDRYKLPVYIDNDASNAARGEYLFGLNKSCANFIFITVGTGIGGGVIIEDNIFRGGNFQGSEIGHMTVVPDGVLCACGNYGCVEAYSSASAIISYVREAINRGTSSVLMDYKDKDIDGSLISRFAQEEEGEEGDGLCVLALRRSAYYLGIALSNLLAALNFPLVVIGGGIAESGEFYLDMIREAIDDNILATFRGTYSVIRSSLGTDAGIIGSGSYVFMEEDVASHP